MAHRWHFFRAGGVDQVSLRDGKDLTSIAELDQKLWVALAMPTKGVDIDPITLDLLDEDKDGRIRVHDIQREVEFIGKTFKDPDDVLETEDEVDLTDLKDEAVVTAAKRMLKDLGKADSKVISVADADAITKAFADTKLNGDGIVIDASTDDADLKKTITDAIASVGSVVDRSGKPGIDKAKADDFWKAIDERAAWLAKGTADLKPLGDATQGALDAFGAVRAKIDDFFTRCRVAAYEPRGAAALNAQDAELVQLATKEIDAGTGELAKLPIAQVSPVARLSLSTGLNPAWAGKIATFVEQVVKPLIGQRDALTPADLDAITAKLAAYETWHSAEPANAVKALDAAWVERLAKPELRAQLQALIDQDKALSAEYDQINSVVRAVRYQRDFGRIARNFINFSDFYSKQDGVFQAGTLYLDARALHMCVPVIDAGKHAALAGSSDAYLAYCDITRNGVTQQIAAAITNGDEENIFVGRNGVFYDRKKQGWDATVTKVISNPISIRQAFWSPYKKLVKVIEDNVTKRAEAAHADSLGKIESAGTQIATVDKATEKAAEKDIAAAAVVAPPAPPKEEKKGIDLGTIAAIGVAIGGVGTLVGALLTTIFGLGVWVPFGIIGIMLLISGPAMLLAWLKLRRRNLGPILDANGWAINSRAKINVAFGAALTELAKLPPGSERTMDDPYADKKTKWKRWVFLAILLILGGSWYVGKLDDLLPDTISSANVLGDNAPIVKKRKAEADAKAKAEADAAKAKADADAKAAAAAQKPSEPVKKP
ncbi:MAG: hypothetical protein QM831_00740 [Kofleriaceae bacterium]